MILVTYGWHRNEGTPWLIGRILEEYNKDEHIKFKDLSQVHDRNEKGICREVVKTCREYEEKGEKIDVIFDLHRTGGSTNDEYRKEVTSFCLWFFKKIEYTKKLSKFIEDSEKWAEPLKTYSVDPLGAWIAGRRLSLRERAGVRFLPRNLADKEDEGEMRCKFLGEYIKRYMSCEIAWLRDNTIEEISKRYHDVVEEHEKLPPEEQTERWHEILDREMDILGAMPEQTEALDEVREDIAKLLQILKKYVS